MRPFKVFFGLSLAIMLFFVVAKFFVFAFFAAAIMSIIYAVFRRLKDFVNYDSYGEPYFKHPARYRAMSQSNQSGDRTFILFADSGQTTKRRRKRKLHPHSIIRKLSPST